MICPLPSFPMTEWTQADMHAMINTVESRSPEDDTKEDIDRVFHRHVAKLQMAMVEKLQEVVQVNETMLVTPEGVIFQDGWETTCEEIAIHEEFERAMEVMTQIRDRARARARRALLRMGAY
jgi:hypothetical protein